MVSLRVCDNRPWEGLVYAVGALCDFSKLAVSRPNTPRKPLTRVMGLAKRPTRPWSTTHLPQPFQTLAGLDGGYDIPLITADEIAGEDQAHRELRARPRRRGGPVPHAGS